MVLAGSLNFCGISSFCAKKQCSSRSERETERERDLHHSTLEARRNKQEVGGEIEGGEERDPPLSIYKHLLQKMVQCIVSSCLHQKISSVQTCYVQILNKLGRAEANQPTNQPINHKNKNKDCVSVKGRNDATHKRKKYIPH